MNGLKRGIWMMSLACACAWQGNAQSTNTVNKTSDTVLITAPKPTPVIRKPIVRKPKPIRTEFSGGLRLNSDGWGIFVDKGWTVSEDKRKDYFYDVKLFQVELDEKKHQAEIKRTNTLGAISDQKSKPFIFAKTNNFYTLKIGYGKRKMIAGKPEIGNVSIHWVYLGGLSAGLLKPYYITAAIRENGVISDVRDIKYTDSTKQSFLDRGVIYGSAGFSKGLNELSIVPGAHIKTALHFDFAASKTSKLAVETGVNAEIYSKKIELMAQKDALPYFINVYASIQFGKRWQ